MVDLFVFVVRSFFGHFNTSGVCLRVYFTFRAYRSRLGNFDFFYGKICRSLRRRLRRRCCFLLSFLDADIAITVVVVDVVARSGSSG